MTMASAFLNRAGQLACHFAAIEVVWIFRDTLQRIGQLRLLEEFTGLVVVAIALEDAVRFWKLSQIRIGERPGLIVVQHKTIARQPDRRFQDLLQGELTPMLLSISKSRDRPGHSNRLVPHRAHVRDDIASAIEIHVGGGLCRRFFTIIKEVHRVVCAAEEHKSASTDIAGLGINHSQGEANCHCSVHGIATLLHDRHARLRRLGMHRRHHGSGCMAGMHYVPCFDLRRKRKDKYQRKKFA